MQLKKHSRMEVGKGVHLRRMSPATNLPRRAGAHCGSLQIKASPLARIEEPGCCSTPTAWPLPCLCQPLSAVEAGPGGEQTRPEATRIPSSQPSDRRFIPHFSCHLSFVQFSSLFHEYFILRATAPLPP